MKNSKLMMNTAISVCFAVTSLFCGLTVARAQEPDNHRLAVGSPGCHGCD